MAITIKLRRTSNQLSTVTEVPKQGEAVYGLTDKQLVIGDGSTQVKNLPRFYAKTWQGDIIAATYGGTGNNSGYIRAGLASGVTAGSRSTAEGYSTQSTGRYSHTEGLGTIAKNQSQHVFGQYNIEDPSSAATTGKGTFVEIVGNGTGTSARSNARTLDWNGNEILSGKITVGQGPVNNMDVATKQYVDNGLSGKQNSFPDATAVDQSLVTINASGSVEWKNISTTLTLTDGTSSAAPKLQVTVLNKPSSTVTLTTADTNKYGVTKLYSGVDSTSNSLAATAGAVKTAYDLASQKENAFSILGVAKGGTGSSSFTANSLIISNTTTTGNLKTISNVAAGSALVSKGTTTVPGWQTISPTVTLTDGTSSAAPSIKISVLAQNSTVQSLNTATTGKYGVTKLSSTASSTEEGLAATPKGVNAALTSAINALNVTTSGGAVNKTITALTQTNGKIAATYTAIGSLNTSVLTAGTLGVARGGTGATTFTSGALLIGNGTSAVSTRSITNNTSATAIGTDTSIPTMNTIYNGLPKINNSHNYTSSSGIYAPPNGGNSGDVLLSMGPTATPVWGQLAMSFLNSSDLDNLYVWDILSTASSGSFYVSWEPSNNNISVAQSKKYIHIYKSVTATSASALTLSSYWQTITVPGYGSGSVEFLNNSGQDVYLYPTTSSTHTSSVSGVSPSNVFRINAGMGTYMSTGYINTSGPYVRFNAHNVIILTGQSVNCTTETNTLTSHTNSRSSTGLTLCRGSLRQLLLGTRMGSYVGTYTDINNETSSSYTIQFPLLPGSSSTCWIPRVLLISGQFTWGSIQTPTRPCSLLIDCHNLIGNQAGNFNPIVIASLQTYTGGTSTSATNAPAVSWNIISSKIRGITLTGYANIFNSSGNTYQYYALA